MIDKNTELAKSVKQFQQAMSEVKSLTGASVIGPTEIALANALMVDMRLRSIEETIYGVGSSVDSLSTSISNELDSIWSQLGHIRNQMS